MHLLARASQLSSGRSRAGTATGSVSQPASSSATVAMLAMRASLRRASQVQLETYIGVVDALGNCECNSDSDTNAFIVVQLAKRGDR